MSICCDMTSERVWVTIWWRIVPARRTKVACTTHSSGRCPDCSIKRRDAVTTTSRPVYFTLVQHVTHRRHSEARWWKNFCAFFSTANRTRSIYIILVTRRSPIAEKIINYKKLLILMEKFNPFRLPAKNCLRWIKMSEEWTTSRIVNSHLCNPDSSPGGNEK